MSIPHDTARCPGKALTDMKDKRIYTDSTCEGCGRLVAARADTSAWIEAGRPTKGDRDQTPAMRCTWMSAPRETPCPLRIDAQPRHTAAADDRRGQEKSPADCTRLSFPAA